MYLAFDTIDISAHYRHVAKSKNLRGQVERRRLLIRQNLGEQLPPLPPNLLHA